MIDYYIGVDPGTTGAVAMIDKQGGVNVYDFETMEALDALLAVKSFARATACVEKVASMPKQGVSTTFKFGKNTGRVIGWLEALGIPFVEVTPTKWQKMVYDSGEKMADKKAQSLQVARKLFPAMLPMLKRKKDHNRADALLIAEYCRKVNQNG